MIKYYSVIEKFDKKRKAPQIEKEELVSLGIFGIMRIFEDNRNISPVASKIPLLRDSWNLNSDFS